MGIQYVDLVNGSDTIQTLSQQTGSITAATKANPCQITSAGHGLLSGDSIVISGIVGMTQLNALVFTITYVDVDNFTLNGINSSAYGTYTSGGTWATAITRANPAVVTNKSHGLGNGQWIRLTLFSGMTQVNTNVYKTANVTTNTFELQDTNGNNLNSTAFSTISGSTGIITIWRKTPITSMTNANPCVITAYKHNFVNGDIVIIENCTGATTPNGKAYTVANKTTDTFELSAVDSTSWGTYTSLSGTVTKPFLTMNTLNSYYGATTSPQNSFYMQGDNVYFAKTFTRDATIQVGSGNITFTRNSTSVTTSVDLRASISVGDYIGLTTATMRGWDISGSPTRPDLYYKVTATAAGSITIETRYMSTTTTVSTINRLRIGTEIRATGAASVNAITTNATGINYSGGYDFIHNTTVARNDGETAFKPVTDSGDLYNWACSDTSSTFSYLSFVEASRGLVMSGTGCTIQYCYARTKSSSGIYCFVVGGNTLQYCTSTASVGYPNIFANTTNGVVDYCYGNNGTSSQPFIQISTSILTVTNCKVECGTYGFLLATANSKITNCTVDTATQIGIIISQNAASVINCTVTSCPTGISIGTANGGTLIKGCTITSCTTLGIQGLQGFAIIIEDTNFSGNVSDINTDQYSHGFVVRNCSTTTPTNWFIQRAALGGCIQVADCTIDAPSVAKALQIVSGDNYFQPQYAVQNSFGSTWADGQYYAKGSYTKDSSTYRTSAPSMKMVYNSTVSNTLVPLRIVSTYVASGVARTYNYYLKADSSPTWSGSIIPILRLNGKLIKTGTTITSLTTSWVQYTITADAADITVDGELTLEFTYNANTCAIWVDDVTVS